MTTLDSNLRYRVVFADVTCEACERKYRLAPDGLHYNDKRGGVTWGVCRFVTAALNGNGECYWLDRKTNQPLTYKDGSEARWTSLDEAIEAFVSGQLSVERNEVLPR